MTIFETVQITRALSVCWRLAPLLHGLSVEPDLDKLKQYCRAS